VSRLHEGGLYVSGRAVVARNRGVLAPNRHPLPRQPAPPRARV